MRLTDLSASTCPNLKSQKLKAQKVILWSVIQLMTHFTGNNFWCNYNISAAPGALQLAPNHGWVQSLEMRSEECDPGPQHHHNTNRFPTAAIVELLLLWWTLPWHLETAAHNRPLKLSQSEARVVSARPMRDELLFNGLRDEMMIT